MKHLTTLSIALAMSASGWAFAQSGHMNGMDMPMGMHKDMHGDMKGQNAAKNGETHHASATVKSIDLAKATVTLAHEPVKSLNWPAMTMGFAVQDKALFDKLKKGEKVQVEFIQQGSKYTVTSVK